MKKESEFKMIALKTNKTGKIVVKDLKEAVRFFESINLNNNAIVKVLNQDLSNCTFAFLKTLV